MPEVEINARSLPEPYRGRLAPSPTGHLHLGHARTFWTAQERARAAGGALVLRIEDLDAGRCQTEFVQSMHEDLKWFGFAWDEGPDLGGPFAPYEQSRRGDLYEAAFQNLLKANLIYPCACSRRDIERAAAAPHADEEAIYPGTCRGKNVASKRVAWRFRLSEGEPVEFIDNRCGKQRFICGEDFGDFVVWRQDGIPAYQLAVVVDDAAMKITEVVRGADLLLSTARQLLLYRALSLPAPEFYHCPLLLDERGVRLAKRHRAFSLRSLRTEGRRPEDLRGI